VERAYERDAWMGRVMTLGEIIDLLKRVRALKGPDREVDLILGALCPDPPFNLSLKAMRNRKPVCPSFTGDLNATYDLIEVVFPGAYTLLRDDSVGYHAEVKPRNDKYWCEWEADTRCLALITCLVMCMKFRAEKPT